MIESKAGQATQSVVVPMTIVAILFFILGFVTWLNGSLMPYLQQILKLTPLQASFILFSFYIAVTFTALPSAIVVRKIGYKNGMALGMAAMMTAGFLYIPAAKTQTFGLFLLAQLVLGVGQTLLQTAVNPYVVRIGPEKSAAVRVSIMGILNKGAGIFSPMIFTALIVANFTGLVGKDLSQAEINAMADGLVVPYLGMAVLIGCLALAVKFSPLPELVDDAEQSGGKGQIKAALAHPSLVLGVVAIFLYVAVEVIAADTIGAYALSLGISHYSVMTSYTMVCMVVGYALGIALIPRVISQQTALSATVVLGFFLVLALVFINQDSTVIANAILVPLGGSPLPDTILLLALCGFANAAVWPAVWPLALSGLGRLTSVGSGLLVMGIAGGAFGPLLYSLASGSSGSAEGHQQGYLVMLPCYLYILFYALKGHKMTSWSHKPVKR